MKNPEQPKSKKFTIVIDIDDDSFASTNPTRRDDNKIDSFNYNTDVIHCLISSYLTNIGVDY